MQIVNNQEPEIGSIRVEPEEGSSGSGKITVGDNIQIIGGDFAGYDGGQTNSGKPGRCLIEINGPSIPVGSAFENDCKAEWDIGSGGTYDVTITPYDNTGLAGDPITKTLDLDVAPKISLPLSRGGNKRVHFNDTISSFDQEFGENPKTGKKITGEMAAKFETGNSIGYGSGSCEALIYDQSGSLIDTQTISQSIEDKSLPGSIDKEIELTCNVDASVSGLDDGMYYLKVRATDSDNNELTTQRKVFYICNDLTSAGTNWNCSLADFDADGYTDGIKQPFNYSDGSGGLQKLSCDSCPTKVNAGEDADMDGIDAACDPDEDPSDYIATPITPANEETGVNTSTVLEVSVIDTKGGDPMNVSFYNAADDSLIGYDENVASGDEASVLWANLLSGTSYSWYVIVDDGSIVGNSETWSFTTAGDGDDDSGSSSGGVSGGGGGFGGVANTAPEVTLNSPGINELFSSTSVEFNCSVNDTDANLANVSLKIDGLVVDTIDALPSTSLETYTWTRTLENGLYNWTCKAVDDAGASTEPIARDFEVNTSADTTSPVLNIIFPGNKTYDDPVSELNYTYEEDNPEKCWYSVDSGLTNSSSVEMGINFTNVTSETGLNNWTLYCNDSNGNVGSDEISFRVRGFRWIYLILGLILLFIAFMFYSYLVYRKEKKKYPKIRKMRFDEWLVHKMSVGIKKTGEFFKRAWKKIKRDTKLLFTHPKQFFREKGQAIKKGFRNLGKWFRKVGKNIKIGFQNLGKWFNKQARNIKEFFKNLFKKKK